MKKTEINQDTTWDLIDVKEGKSVFFYFIRLVSFKASRPNMKVAVRSGQFL